MKIHNLLQWISIFIIISVANTKVAKQKSKHYKTVNTQEDQYKIPRKNIIITSPPQGIKQNQNQNDPLDQLLSTNTPESEDKPINLEKIRRYTKDLLSQLEAKGKRMAQDKRRETRQKMHNLRSKRGLRIRGISKHPKRQRKALFGPSSEDLHKKDMLDQEHNLKFIAKQVMWDDEMSAHRSARELKLMIDTVNSFTDRYVMKMDQLVMSINGELEEEDENQHDLDHHEKEQELEMEKHDLSEQAEHEHEEFLDEKEHMLDQEAKKLEMEERMENDIKNLHDEGEIHSLEEPVTKDQLNLVQQQMITLQQQLAGLQSSVEENETNKVDLQEKIKSLLPPGMAAGDSNKLVGNLKEFKKREEKYEHTKNDLEMKITRTQQQVNTMQHQLNLMHQKQNQLDLESDVENMVDDRRH
jgi:hypothetical protein